MTITKIAKVTGTFLGIEDHGILTAQLRVDYGGAAQSIGGYCLDEPVREDGKFICRQGSAYGMEWVKRCIGACGVDTWEKIVGRTILVHFADDQFPHRPLGVGPLPTEPGDVFMFDALARDFDLVDAS